MAWRRYRKKEAAQQQGTEGEILARAEKKALRILEMSDRSEEEIRKKLEEGGFPPHVVSEVCAWLKDLHYLDDARYARGFALSRISRKSIAVIRMELRQKGIADDLIEDACAEVSDQEPEAAYHAAVSYVGSKTGVPREKVIASILRKGFPYPEAREACRRLEEENPGILVSGSSRLQNPENDS